MGVVIIVGITHGFFLRVYWEQFFEQCIYCSYAAFTRFVHFWRRGEGYSICALTLLLGNHIVAWYMETDSVKRVRGRKETSNRLINAQAWAGSKSKFHPAMCVS
jgi:hypothetical protein